MPRREPEIRPDQGPPDEVIEIPTLRRLGDVLRALRLPRSEAEYEQEEAGKIIRLPFRSTRS